MKALVGYSGFVGSNILAHGDFGPADGLYDINNIKDSFGTKPDLLYYSGVPAQKFIADRDPAADLEIILDAAENIRKISPKEIVLISTVDVYKDTAGFSESSYMAPSSKDGYGANRLYLEQLVADMGIPYHIVRLPGLFGENIKKNFIYDFINFIPALLAPAKMEELSGKEPSLKNYYAIAPNGFWRVKEGADRPALKEIFKRVGFSALNFTDSRSVYQYYNLANLYKDIQIVLKNDLKVMNLMTQPVSTDYLYSYLTGKKFVNHILDKPLNYDIRTDYAPLFGGKDGYIATRDSVCKEIKGFVESKV